MTPLAALMRAKHNAFPEMAWELELAARLGLPTLGMLRFTLAFFLSLLAGAIMRLVPNTKARHLYSFVSGLALVYYPFGSSSLHALPPALATYAVMRLVPRKCGTLAWLVNFPYLLCLHAANASGMSWNSGEVDFTGGQMVLTLKMIALAVCVQDAWGRGGAADDAAAAAGGARGTGGAAAAGAGAGAAAAAGSPSKQRRDASNNSNNNNAAVVAADPGNGSSGNNNQGVLTRYQASHAVPSCPPLLDFLGYCFCFGNLLGGPFMEYSDYARFAARQGEWSPSARPRPAPVGAAFLQGARALFTALVCAGLHSLWSPVWNGQLFLSDWWKAASLPVRLLAFCACGTTVRMKYYFAWGLGEASCALAGLDFVGWSDGVAAGGQGGSGNGGGGGSGNGGAGAAAAADAPGRLAGAGPSMGGGDPALRQAVAAAAVATAAPSAAGAPLPPSEGQQLQQQQQQQASAPAPPQGPPKPIFGRCRNCDVIKVEFGDSSRVMPAHWNVQTGVFLRRYVYERVTPPGRKPTFRTLLITQLVAGVWHGLYPGYFLFFASSALYFAHSTTLYYWEKGGLVPGWLVRFRLYRAAKILATKICLDYSASAFQLLTWRECLATYASVHWLPHAYMAAWLLLGRLVPAKKRAGGGGAARAEVGGAGAGAGAAAATGEAGKAKAA